MGNETIEEKCPPDPKIPVQNTQVQCLDFSEIA